MVPKIVIDSAIRVDFRDPHAVSVDVLRDRAKVVLFIDRVRARDDGDGPGGTGCPIDLDPSSQTVVAVCLDLGIVLFCDCNQILRAPSVIPTSRFRFQVSVEVVGEGGQSPVAIDGGELIHPGGTVGVAVDGPI